jgi:hypothetical protein
MIFFFLVSLSLSFSLLVTRISPFLLYHIYARIVNDMITLMRTNKKFMCLGHMHVDLHECGRANVQGVAAIRKDM